MISFSGISISKISENTDSFSETFEIGPLPKGYGYTLGNSLRRVLLSSLEGAAITSVRINNLDHEFTTIPGVRQNVLDIILRLKNLRIKLNSSEPTILTLSKKGVGPVLAKDFATSSDVQIINEDFVIADLTDASAHLTIEAVVENGVGYIRADESLRDEIGRIPVDSIFSPVRIADAKVLPSRKGARTDLDKIVLSVTTDGTVSPAEALRKGIEILKNFYDEMAIVSVGSESGSSKKSESKESMKLTEVVVSEEVRETLMANGMTTIDEVAAKPKSFYQKDLGMKAKQLKELLGMLEQYNLSFAKDAKKSKKS